MKIYVGISTLLHCVWLHYCGLFYSCRFCNMKLNVNMSEQCNNVLLVSLDWLCNNLLHSQSSDQFYSGLINTKKYSEVLKAHDFRCIIQKRLASVRNPAVCRRPVGCVVDDRADPRGTYWCRPIKYVRSQRWMMSSMPNVVRSRWRGTEWSTVSKPLTGPKEPEQPGRHGQRPVGCPTALAVSVKWPGRNPDCSDGRRSTDDRQGCRSWF